MSEAFHKRIARELQTRRINKERRSQFVVMWACNVTDRALNYESAVIYSDSARETRRSQSDYGMKVNARIRARSYRAHIRTRGSRETKRRNTKQTKRTKGKRGGAENLCKAGHRMPRVTFLPNPGAVRPPGGERCLFPSSPFGLRAAPRRSTYAFRSSFPFFPRVTVIFVTGCGVFARKGGGNGR